MPRALTALRNGRSRLRRSVSVPVAARVLVLLVGVLSVACAADRPDNAGRPAAPGSTTDAARRLAPSPPASPPPGGSPMLAREPFQAYEGEFADPFLLLHDGVYHAFSTQGSYGEIQLIRSPDLVYWELLPLGALAEVPAWAVDSSVWGPAVLPVDDGFVLYYAALERASGLHCISGAMAAEPEGPYVDVSEGPIVCPRAQGGAIDPSPVVDDDGRAHLLWKNDGIAVDGPSSIYSQPLRPDGLATDGPAVPLVTADRPWEEPHVEAPSMTATDDGWLLAYSANWYNQPDYGVGLARCGTVSGPCTKLGDGPVLDSFPGGGGPGGAEFFRVADGSTWMAFHAWQGGVVGYPSHRALWIAPVDPADPVAGLPD